MKLSNYYSKEDLEMIRQVGEIPADEFMAMCEELVYELERISDTSSDEFIAFTEQKEDLLFYRCATDIELFAILYFAHYCTSEFNDFHLDTFKDYTFGERGVRGASCAPRGFAKSTIEAVVKPVHDICYKLERYIVVVSNTKPQAIAKLKDIKNELENNADLISMYGAFFKGRVAGTEDYIVYSGDTPIRLHAVGSGTEIRGARFFNYRPTKIVNDDVEHSEHTESEEQREKMQNWFTDVISKIGANYTNIKFVGTVLHPKSLLKFLLRNPRYKSREYKAIVSWADRRDLWEKWTSIYTDLDNDDRAEDAQAFYDANQVEMDKGCKVLWPEEKPYYKLQEEIIEIGMRSFMKEMQNDPMSSEEKPFSPEDTQWCRLVDDGIYIEKSKKTLPFSVLQCLGAIDPSAGKNKPSGKKKPDYTSMLLCYFHEKTRRLFVVKDLTKRIPPSKYIKQIFDFHEVYKFYKFGVETNLYRGLLMENIKKERDRRNAGIPDPDDHIKIKFYEIEQHENKHERIFTIEPKIFHGNIVLSRDLSPEALGMLWDFPFGGHDDFPDVLHQAWELANNRYGSTKAKIKASPS